MHRCRNEGIFIYIECEQTLIPELAWIIRINFILAKNLRHLRHRGIFTWTVVTNALAIQQDSQHLFPPKFPCRSLASSPVCVRVWLSHGGRALPGNTNVNNYSLCPTTCPASVRREQIKTTANYHSSMWVPTVGAQGWLHVEGKTSPRRYTFITALQDDKDRGQPILVCHTRQTSLPRRQVLLGWGTWSPACHHHI